MNKPILFIGDSLTAWGNWEMLFPDISIINFGVPGDKTYDILERLEQARLSSPSSIFLMAGINDLGDGRKKSDIINDYTRITDHLKKKFAGTNIHLLSLLPVDENKLNGLIQQHQIIELNLSIETIATENDLFFIDLFSSFLDGSGQLKNEYSADGVHLSGAGYLNWKNNISAYLYN